MISVVIPTLNAERDLARVMSALVPAAVDGLVRQVIVADGGSTDHTLEIAESAGAEITTGEAGRGRQLRAGAAMARFPWLLFLHADTELETGWDHEASLLMERVDRGRLPQCAGVFSFALDDLGIAPRVLETVVSWRTHLMRLPYGDQGLLLPRRLYDKVGGFSDLPLMEDVDLVRRLGWQQIRPLRARALTSAARYRRDGYLSRIARNQSCLLLFYAGVPIRTIARLYGTSETLAMPNEEGASR